MHTTRAFESSRAPLRRRACAVVAAALLWLSAASGGPASARRQADAGPGLLAPYNAAIYDSSVYKFSNLRPLRPLEFDAATGTAKVVSATDWGGYKLGANNLSRDVWVTGAGEVQGRCRGFAGDVEMRLVQLLGLHPARRLTNFVSMTVRREDVFRPTADSDPTTTLPCSCPVAPTCGTEFPKGVTPQHRLWFGNQMFSSYVLSESPSIPVGYPWTRLGYTYDWKPGAEKYGVSEYVVKAGSTVTVTEIVPLKQYCSPAPGLHLAAGPVASPFLTYSPRYWSESASMRADWPAEKRSRQGSSE